jgi:hypothetical protein
MIYVEKSSSSISVSSTTKRKAISYIIAALVAVSAIWVGYNYIASSSVSDISKTSATNCPSPPCEIIIVGGMQICVYQNNHARSCP